MAGVKKKNSIKEHKKRVWKAFSDYIRERDKWVCYTCGKMVKGQGMHSGHYISRTHSSVMFDEMNVHAQCYRCNIHLHGNLGEYTLRLIKDYGIDAVDDLRRKGNKVHRITHEELEEIYVHSRDRLKELKDNNDTYLENF